MKSLFIGVAIIIVVGFAGFFYRAIVEKSHEPEPVACTMEAKMCPDGSSVGRSGPSCAFDPCPLPNAEDGEIGVGFVIPAAYVSNPDAIGADQSLRVVLDKPSAGDIPHSIVIRDYAIPAGKTAEEVIIAKTIFEPKDAGAESIKDFTKETIGDHTFYVATVERFEAIVHSVYYLPRANDVLEFEVIERNVMSWSDANLSVNALPEHTALRAMLQTLQLSK